MHFTEGKRMANKITQLAVLTLVLSISSVSAVENDVRQLVQFPEMMQQHLISNMRDHLVVINEILLNKCLVYVELFVEWEHGHTKLAR